MDDLLESHREAALDRCRGEPVVLALQGATALTYRHLAMADWLAPPAGRGQGAREVPAHVGLAVSPDRRPLGVYELDAAFRVPRDKKARKEKESRRRLDGFRKAERWGEACAPARVVSVCDREGDLWPLLKAAARASSAGLLARVNPARHRSMELAESDLRLLSALEGREPLMRKTLQLRAREAQAELEIRAMRVHLRPPKQRKNDKPLELLAAWVTEPAPPPGRKPLRWMLLSTEGEATAEWALRLVEWYEAHWTIEEYFNVLKKCVRRDGELDAESPRECIALDAVAACRVFEVQRAALDRPDAPAGQVVPEEEIEALYFGLRGFGIRMNWRPTAPPDIRTFAVDLGRIAGFIPSRRQPLPGARKLWQGYRRVQVGSEYLRAFRQHR